MTTTNNGNSKSGSVSYDHDQNTNIDSTRGKLLTDIQMSAETVPMASSTTQMALNDTTRHEIMSILERPVNLGTFEWTSSDTALPIQLPPDAYDNDTQNFLQQFNFPQSIFANSPIVVDKLKNYQYLKADIEIEVKINAQPFLQGALMLVYNPYYNQTGDFRRKGTRFLASQTSCPYKIISIEEGNSIKLVCPYANIYDLFDLGNSDNQFGTVFLYVFSNLIGPTVAAAKYTVFARFINPEFYVPTQNDVMATHRDLHEIRRLEDKGYKVRNRRRIAQSNVAPVSAPDSGESSTPGPVSKIASGVTTVADVLSEVPLIGKVASTVAWVSRAIGRTAASFGWSKPITIQPQSKVVNKPNSSLIHIEGTDDSTTLALLQDNGIDGSSFIPETKDEMSLSYIFGRPNFFHAQTASASLFSDRKLITAWEVSPLSEYQYGHPDDSQTMFMGSFAYSSMQGTLWRGTINYDGMVIKTAYHQGRFAAVFLPETNLADVPPTLGDLLNTNYNVVCNLKDRQDEMGRTNFRFSVPFVSNTDWRETYKRSVTGLGPDATTLDTKTGCVALYSLVDLSHPPTVAGSVTFYIAHSGGEDYQIARPTLNLAPGYQTRYAESDVGAVFVPQDEDLLIPQSKSQDVTAQTTGEYFKSLRSIVKRFNFFGRLSQADTYTGFKTRGMVENADGIRTMSRTSFDDRVVPTSWYMSSFLYRFYNGSSMLKVIPFTAGTSSESYLRFDEDMASQMVLNESDSYGQPVFQQLQQMSNSYEVRTPYYRGVRCDVVGSNQVPILGDVRTCVRTRNRGGFGSSSIASDLYEAAGDDFNFFFLIGPPPMSDIRNVTEVTTFPTGTTVTVNVSAVSSVNEVDGNALFFEASFSPEIAVGDGNIASASIASVPLVTENAGTVQVDITRVSIYKNSTNAGIRVPLDGQVTAAGAAAAIAALGTFTVITDAVLA